MCEKKVVLVENIQGHIKNHYPSLSLIYHHVLRCKLANEKSMEAIIGICWCGE